MTADGIVDMMDATCTRVFCSHSLCSKSDKD